MDVEDHEKNLKTKTRTFYKKNPEDERIYKTHKKLFENLRKKSNQCYYSELLEKHKGKAKQRWQVLEETTGKVQKKNQSLATTLETKNGSISHKKCYC